MPIIRRYFSQSVLEIIKADCAFLVDKIISSGFEYDLQIRDNYFNLYYKGNSLGKVSYRIKAEQYSITVHHRFISDKISQRFPHKSQGAYLTFNLSRKQLHPFFSSQNLASMGQRVKEVPSQEEINFEQMLMTDNVFRKDLIIIDRQIMDKASSTKMDLLALLQKQGSDYQFCIIEVKLGNNPELKGEVASQLKNYIARIKAHFNDYKECYELNFRQKQELGLFDKALAVKIVPGVSGIIVVGAYSGIAEKSIAHLRKMDATLKILHLKNRIHVS